MADDAPTFSVVLHFDPQMVAELALGADHPHEIAERYGVDLVDYEHLAEQPWFEQLVAAKRTEYHASGILFTAKAAMMAESLFTRLFQQSMTGSLAQPLMVETAKQLADIGRLKPQPLNTQPPPGTGPAFQINIQVNGADVMGSSNPRVAGVVASTRSADASSGDGASSRGEATTMRLEFEGDVPAPAPAAPALPSVADPPAPDIAAVFDAMPGPPVPIKVPDFDLRVSSLVGNAQAVQAANQPAPPTLGLPKDTSLR